ncbi:type IV pilus modification protein PilV [Zooshikella ganghwensis]|uniref:type IV pilus modification protein PilV n=1 Tax=Zooshikella ganghwensis TaxID=202772 RepID=UPI0003FC36DF|nr:type IV pilus modification protein PilV [Zooshikella ganghwensis]
MIKKQSGISMIEVLITMLIMGIGLLGIAGLMLFSIKTSNSNYFSTQAMFLTQDLIGRMRANPEGVWKGHYTLEENIKDKKIVNCNEARIDCDEEQRAKADLYEWAKKVGMVDGENATAPMPPIEAEIKQRKDNKGIYKIEISWKENKRCYKNDCEEEVKYSTTVNFCRNKGNVKTNCF